MTEIQMVIDSIRSNNENQRIVVLKEKDTKRCLIIYMGVHEADQIEMKLAGIELSRPSTHEFYCKIFNVLGGELKKVIIKEIRNDTYFANTIICANNNTIECDCRPCDALAFAITLNAPIFADKDVLDQYGLFLTEEDQLEYYGLSKADFEKDK